MARGLTAEAHFDAVDAIDRGVARRGAAQHFDAGAGQKTEVRKVVADLVRQVDGLDDACVADDAAKILGTVTDDCVITESHGPTYRGKDQVARWVSVGGVIRRILPRVNKEVAGGVGC